jgi:acyl-CoA synthetase (NDP forming)
VGQALEATAARHPDRALIVSCLAEPETVRAYEDAGFPVFEDADRAVGALASLASAGEAVARGLPRRAEGRGRPVQVMTGTEDEAKRLLAAAGVPVSADCLAGSADEAVAAAERVGYPVAIKVVSPDVLHKTDAGGVELDVADAVGARAAYASVRRRALAHIPNARIDGVLVSPMAPAGVDVIVGSHRDPTFGPVVAFGLGGIFVEVLDDVALALAPVDEERAHRMIRSVRGYPLLAGARGGEPVDLDALARAIASVSRFAAANTETVASLDINPLRASAAGVVALDASIVPTGR